MNRRFPIIALLALAASARAGDGKPARKAEAAPAPPKVVQALRSGQPVTVDGRLDEPVWQGAPAEGFTQSDPQDGSPASERTSVWVAYDDSAIYVAARCWDGDPARITSLLGRRDAQIDSDWFLFSVDPYFDKRSGYTFGVNPAGSLQDAALSNDVNEDSSWDGVWEAETAIDGSGWTVEMRIPFNQIRFPRRDEYVWGVNFQRTIKRKNERASFAWVPRTDSAFVSRFARLEGLRGIRPGRRVELLPYAVASAQLRPSEAGNPFETGHRLLANAGFDLKVGLKSNLTLDATVNPDFGQVEVDPAVINLSAYETYYQEKRPFFIEGASLFNGFGRGGVYINANINWPQPSFFYSRRIGRAPQGDVTEPGYARVPDRTAILAATKLTGNLGGGFNMAFLGAATARETAEIDRAGIRLGQTVEPFSYYGAFRLLRDVKEGRSGYGVMATGVLRDIDSPALAAGLNRNAFSLAFDGWTFLDAKRNWVVGGWAGGTRVEGTAEDILRLQTSSTHYFQRPDASYLSLDPSRTSLQGWGARVNLGKQNGNFLFLASAGALSPGFDPNDAGFQYGASDIVQVQVLPGYQWTKPGKVFQNVLVIAGWARNYDFGGNRNYEGALASIQGRFRNFWEFNVLGAYNPPTVSKSLTRGGPLAINPWGWEIEVMGSTDTRRRVVFELSSTLYRQPQASSQWTGQLSVRWKPASNFSLTAGPLATIQDDDYQWVTRVADPLMTATYGRRYVFGHIEQTVLGSEIRFDWTFTPRLTLQAYLQPFVAVGHYRDFRELARAKSFEYNLYGTGGSTVAYDGSSYTVDPDGAGPAPAFAFGDPDFNVKSLRGTVVLRWEYRPGSLLYFVWTQNRADYSDPGTLRLGRDLGRLLTAPGDNIFMLKVSFRWNG